MVSCNCNFLSSHRRKMFFFGGIGIGVAIILIGLIGFTAFEVGSIGGVHGSNCIALGHGCTMEIPKQNGTSGEKRCCFPYVCQTTRQGMNQSSSQGKCVKGNDDHQQNVTTTTTERSTTPPGQCPYSRKLEQILEPVRGGEEFDKTLEFYKGAAEGYLRLSAHRGDQMRNFKLTVRELNMEARRHISTTTDTVGQNIFPLIVATETGYGFDGVGGIFTIYYEDGSSQTVNPVSQEYEIRKGLSHIPLGIYGILVPYFKLTHAPGIWRKELAAFGEKVKETLLVTQSVSSSFLGAAEIDMVNDSLILLQISYKYISKWLDTSNTSDKYGCPKTVTVAEFEEYSAEIFPFLDKSIRIAAELQMRDVVPVLMKWKKEMGDEKWKEVYAVIPTIWPVSGMNPRFQAIAEVMGPEQAKSQIFILENGGIDVEQLRKILGKIVAHRTAANLIFGTKTARAKEFTFSLSGQQDIMSIDAQDALDAFYRPQ